jgi:hypothetical protein
MIHPLGFHPFDSVPEQFDGIFQIEFLFDSRSVAFHGATAQVQ